MNKPPKTPDGRYIVVNGVLWRATDPTLAEAERKDAVSELMRARRAVRDAGDETATRAARGRVDAAKRRLGERGPVWWTDGERDYTRFKIANTPYADWWKDRGDAG